MLTVVLALALHGCPQRIQVAAPSMRSTTASVSLLECGRRIAGPWPAHVGLSRPLRAPPRGRRNDAARHVLDRPGRLRARRRPGRATSLPPPHLWRLVGRGPALGDLQLLPAPRLRRDACLRRRQRGTLAGDNRVPRVRCCRLQQRAGRTGPRLGDLPARRHGPCHERLCLDTETGPPADTSLASAGCNDHDPGRPNAARPCIICDLLYSSQLDAYRCDHRLRRLCRPGDPRPRARAPGLEPVALGSDSLAGHPAFALDPRLDELAARVRDERRGGGFAAQTSSFSASIMTPPPRSSRPPGQSSSTSPALTGSPTQRSRGPGTASRPAPGATACPSCTRPKAR